MTTARMPHSAGPVAGRPAAAMMSPPYAGAPAAAAPPGTLPPGTRIMVGPIVVTVQRYLSQGGFAHVYLVTTDKPVPMPVSATSAPGSTSSTTRGETLHVLKRMAVPDKEALASVRSEVEIHKSLRSHPNIVHFIEASATALRGGGYEIFILMEYCAGGGIIDLMNARLRTRLTEAEVLKIFGDVAAGLSVMHTMQPPIIHRDLKVENILLAPPPRSTPNVGPTYKLCDFGSSKTLHSRKAAQTLDEVKGVEADLNKHTTLQYRAPEMVDVYQRRVIDEKADIWAMGVLLYKLCYYTTPFEENGGGPLAILNARYRFPSMPPYSQRLKDLIASMLQEHSNMRPTIEEVIVRVHQLSGTRPPASITDNNNGNAQSPTLPFRRSATSSDGGKQAPQHAAGGVTADLLEAGQSEADRRKAEAEELKQRSESITPMRRGRPNKGSATAAVAAKFEQGAALSIPAESGKHTQSASNGLPSPGGFADSFAPSSASNFKRGLTGEQPQKSPSPSSVTPLNHSPVLPGFDTAAASRIQSARASPLAPSAMSPPPATSSARKSSSQPSAEGDETANRFPSVEELDRRYPTDKQSAAAMSPTSSSSMARSPSSHAAKVPGLADRASVSAMAGRYGAMASASSKRVSVTAQAKPTPPMASKPIGLSSGNTGSVSNRWRSQTQSSNSATSPSSSTAPLASPPTLPTRQRDWLSSKSTTDASASSARINSVQSAEQSNESREVDSSDDEDGPPEDLDATTSGQASALRRQTGGLDTPAPLIESVQADDALLAKPSKEDRVVDLLGDEEGVASSQSARPPAWDEDDEEMHFLPQPTLGSTPSGQRAPATTMTGTLVDLQRKFPQPSIAPKMYADASTSPPRLSSPPVPQSVAEVESSKPSAPVLAPKPTWVGSGKDIGGLVNRFEDVKVQHDSTSKRDSRPPPPVKPGSIRARQRTFMEQQQAHGDTAAATSESTPAAPEPSLASAAKPTQDGSRKSPTLNGVNALSAAARPLPSHAPPPPAGSKPLKPWEREALEKEHVEQFGSLRSKSPEKLETGTTAPQGVTRDVHKGPSGGSGVKGEAQERFRGVSSLISQWQANASGRAPGWGTVGGSDESDASVKDGLPKARKQSKDEDELFRRSISPRSPARGSRLPSREV